MNKSGTEWVALTLLPSACMVDRRRGRDSFEESLERSLDKGVSLPASDRLVAMTTRDGGARLGIVVSMPQRPSERTIDLPTAAARSARNPVPSFELHRSCAACTTSVERHAPISCKPLITHGCVVGIAVALQVAHDGSRSAPKRLGLGAGHRSVHRATQGRAGQSAIRMPGRELPRERPVPERASAFAEVRVLAELAAAAWAGVRSG